MSTEDVVRSVTRKLVYKIDLKDEDFYNAVKSVFSVDMSDAVIASFLTALTAAGTTKREIKIIRDVLKEESISVFTDTSTSLIDNCGTGGDLINTFNISTAAAIVAASAECKVAKHGNRSASGLCGSADFFERIGFNLDSSVENVLRCLRKTGMSFFYAPKFHPALRRISSIRKQIGFKTVLNFVGPLCNPCTDITGQVIGVSDLGLLGPISEVMFDSEINHIILVHSDDGLDELSNTSESTVIDIKKSGCRQYRFTPKSVNIRLATPRDIQASSMEDSVKYTMQVIYGIASSAKEDIVILNSSLALMVGDKVDTIEEGIEMARSAVRSGAPKAKLRELVDLCGNKDKLEQLEKVYNLND
ncbi:MAG: anthranilate phosphoribosyltransferase [Nitrososphaeraceae archaeon]